MHTQNIHWLYSANVWTRNMCVLDCALVKDHKCTKCVVQSYGLLVANGRILRWSFHIQATCHRIKK